MNLIFIAIIAACACLGNAQSSCRTPSGQEGQCISLFNCPPLVALVNKKDRSNQEDIDLLKKSHCGYEGTTPTVCCPKPAPEPQSITCYTPEGNSGECISLYSCPHLKIMLKPPVADENVAYIQRSRCKGPDQYSVCCGAPNERTQTLTRKSIIRKGEPVAPGRCEDPLNAYPPDPSSGCCGVDSRVGNKIVGGENTTIDQYPWLVAIEYVKLGVTKLMCGGALISGKYVLTAGHCVTGRVLDLGTPKRVRLGEYDILNEGPDCVAVAPSGEDCTDGVTRIAIEKTIPHPEYDPAHPQKWNDIALIRLTYNAQFTDFIRPICLPTMDLTLLQNRPDNFTLYAAGWGVVSRTEPFSKIKQHVDLPFVSHENCQPVYSEPSRARTIKTSQVCAGGLRGKDSCQGDSGGPLMYEGDSTTVVIGIVSYGPDPCAKEGVPGVYSNVYEYLDWIRSTIVP